MKIAVGIKSNITNFPIKNRKYEPAIGNVNDRVLKIYHFSVPRLGFETTLKGIVKNRGSSVVNGNLKLSFDNSKVEFIEVDNANAITFPNLITILVSELSPFENSKCNCNSASNRLQSIILQLFDTFGKMIFEVDQKVSVIDVSDIECGVYLCIIQRYTYHITTKAFVKY